MSCGYTYVVLEAGQTSFTNILNENKQSFVLSNQHRINTMAGNQLVVIVSAFSKTTHLFLRKTS
jgi:hypothetical protein